MTDSVFYSLIRRLEAAFRVPPLTKESLQVYYEFLEKEGISDEAFRLAVEEIILNEDFFPSIHTLLSYCNSEPSYDAAGRRLQYVR